MCAWAWRFKRGGLGHGLHMMLVKQVSAIAFGWVDGVLECFNWVFTGLCEMRQIMSYLVAQPGRRVSSYFVSFFISSWSTLPLLIQAMPECKLILWWYSCACVSSAMKMCTGKGALWWGSLPLGDWPFTEGFWVLVLWSHVTELPCRHCAGWQVMVSPKFVAGSGYLFLRKASSNLSYIQRAFVGGFTAGCS